MQSNAPGDQSDSQIEPDIEEPLVEVTSDDILIFVTFQLPLVITKENGVFTFNKSRVLIFYPFICSAYYILRCSG